MNVNGVTSAVEAYSSVSYTKTEASVKTTAEVVETKPSAEETGVVYEPSSEVPAKTYKADGKMIAKLKADAEARTEQFRNLVQQLITKQFGVYAEANDIWDYLREGKLEVDPETKAQAEADIAEDGYWGVEQTSDRIIDFATALTGGDPSKIEAMRDAFKKGYEQAEKTWGGKLPDISQRTYDAVMEKFDKLAEQATETFA